MARPIGKYFEPVIKKLIDARKNEVIPLDEQFKARLRMQILDRIELMPRASRFDMSKLSEHAGQLGHGIKHSWKTAWAGLWSQYKYAFALVPSALVVFVVVMQISKMPVQIASNVVVPVVDMTQVNTQAGIGTNGADGAANLLAAESVAEGGGEFNAGDFYNAQTIQSTLQTFPGYMVMPAKYREKYMNQPPTGGGELAEVPKVTSGTITDEPSKITIPVVGPKAANLVIPQAASPKTTGAADATVTSGAATTGATGTTTSDNAASGTTGSTLELKTLINNVVTSTPVTSLPSPTVNPTTPATVAPATSVTPAISVTPTTSAIPATVAPATVTPSTTPVEPATQTTLAAPTVLTSPSTPVIPVTSINAVVNPSMIQSANSNLTTSLVTQPTTETKQAYTISYEVSVADADKASLETKVINPLTESKNVAYVKVSRNRDGFVVVDIYFNDGSKYTAYFLKNTTNGNWQEVKYTTKNYYDTSLQYQKVCTTRDC